MSCMLGSSPMPSIDTCLRPDSKNCRRGGKLKSARATFCSARSNAGGENEVGLGDNCFDFMSANQRNVAAIAAVPVRALLARATLRVVDALLVRAAVDGSSHDERTDFLCADEVVHLAEHLGVLAQIAIAKPLARLRDTGGRIGADSDHDLGRALIVGAVESDRAHRIAAISPARFVVKALEQRLRAGRHADPQCMLLRRPWAAFCAPLASHGVLGGQTYTL